MKPFQYKGKAINFSAVTGVVTGSTKWSETHVSSYGGGGSIRNGSGYVSAPSISSTVVNHHEFWLKGENGQETPVKAGGANIPLREGQKVTAISGFPQGSNSGWWVLLYNHNANLYWNILSTDEFIDYFKLAGKWGYQGFIACLILPFGVLIGFLPKLIADHIYMFTDPGGYVAFAFLFGITLSVIYGVSTYKSVMRKREKIANMILTHFDGLITEILK